MAGIGPDARKRLRRLAANPMPPRMYVLIRAFSRRILVRFFLEFPEEVEMVRRVVADSPDMQPIPVDNLHHPRLLDRRHVHAHVFNAGNTQPQAIEVAIQAIPVPAAGIEIAGKVVQKIDRLILGP